MYVVMTGIDPKEAEYVEVHNQAFKTEKEADTWGRDWLKERYEENTDEECPYDPKADYWTLVEETGCWFEVCKVKDPG
jgi:hypothetical protein